MSVKDYYEKRFYQQNKSEFFSALIPDQVNADLLIPRLRAIEAIDEVILTPQEQLKLKVQELVQQLDVDLTSSMWGQSFFGLQIYFKENVHQSTQKQAIDYIHRMLEGTTAVLSGVQSISNYEKKMNLKPYYFLALVLLSYTMFWVFNSFLFCSKIKPIFQMNKYFQRNGKDKIYTMVVIVLFWFFVSTITSVVFTQQFWWGSLIIAPLAALAIACIALRAEKSV